MRHAKGRGDTQLLLVAPAQRRLLQLTAEHLHQLLASLRIGATQQQAEFLTTQAADHIGLAQAALQYFTQVAQGTVTHLMPPTIVDLLEVIDIQQYQGKPVTTALALLDALLKQLLEAAAVVDPGQRVGLSQALQGLLGIGPAYFIEVHEQQDHQPADHRVAQIDQPVRCLQVGVTSDVQHHRQQHEGQGQQQARLAAQQQVGKHRHHIDPDKGRSRGGRHQHDVDLKAEGRQQVGVDPGRQPAHPAQVPGRPDQQTAHGDLQPGQQGIVVVELQQGEAPQQGSGRHKDQLQQRAARLLAQAVTGRLVHWELPVHVVCLSLLTPADRGV